MAPVQHRKNTTRLRHRVHSGQHQVAPPDLVSVSNGERTAENAALQQWTGTSILLSHTALCHILQTNFFHPHLVLSFLRTVRVYMLCPVCCKWASALFSLLAHMQDTLFVAHEDAILARVNAQPSIPTVRSTPVAFPLSF